MFIMGAGARLYAHILISIINNTLYLLNYNSTSASSSGQVGRTHYQNYETTIIFFMWVKKIKTSSPYTNIQLASWRKV
jgi:hypothetical protein